MTDLSQAVCMTDLSQAVCMTDLSQAVCMTDLSQAVCMTDRRNLSSIIPPRVYFDNKLSVIRFHDDIDSPLSMVWYGNCLFDKIKIRLKHNSKYIISES